VIPEATTFAILLRRHRLARSLTQEQLAERAQITAKAVGALERGERRRPYPHTVRSLARALALDDGERAELENAVPFRVAPRGVAPSRSAATQDRDLSSPPGPVLGREDEADLVSDILRAGERRLITLVGTGGVGKTTLALVAAAAARSEFPGGVVMVDLASVSRGDDVVPKIRAALGVPEAAFDGSVAALATYLSGGRTLLVLDTVEHVLSSGPEIAGLVISSPDLVVLCTSRAPLSVRVEHQAQVRVVPLTPETAIELYRERVAAAGRALEKDDRTQQAVAALCARTDGLPLAV
jgi:transcriptional regulator with XRE-family HTH domain